jgi:hypothetical protein
MLVTDPESHPLCQLFLSEYLANHDDPTNFPPDEVPALFDRYEQIFRTALDTLRVSPEQLKGRPEFDFAHTDQGNFEGAIAVLRAVEALRLQGFSNITLLKPPGADLVCEKNGYNVCCEVKAITKASTPQKGLFFADQVHAKVMENIGHARKQLEATAAKLGCATMFVCVSSWFDQAIYLNEQDYQYIVNRLEKDKLEGEDNYLESLKGIDAVLFATKAGQVFWFVNDKLRAAGFGRDTGEAPNAEPLEET